MMPLFVTISGSDPLHLLQHLERDAVFRPGAHQRRQSLDGLDIVIENMRPCFGHNVEALFTRVEIRALALR